jgi:hypothetical protein
LIRDSATRTSRRRRSCFRREMALTNTVNEYRRTITKINRRKGDGVPDDRIVLEADIRLEELELKSKL